MPQPTAQDRFVPLISFGHLLTTLYHSVLNTVVVVCLSISDTSWNGIETTTIEARQTSGTIRILFLFEGTEILWGHMMSQRKKSICTVPVEGFTYLHHSHPSKSQ